MDASITLRDARDDDAPGLIALIGGVFAEYPGCVLDVDGELPELRRIASAFAAWRGRFWVATRDATVVGCVGVTPAIDGAGVELRKLYVHRTHRSAGLGGALHDRVLHHAREHAAEFIELWSDTRFETAHGFYERRGYVRGTATRALHDLSHSIEFYFRKPLVGDH